MQLIFIFISDKKNNKKKLKKISLMVSIIHHVKQPVSVRSRVRRRKAILALLDQLTSFGQRKIAVDPRQKFHDRIGWIVIKIGTHIFLKTSGLLNTEPLGRKAIFAHLVISSHQESFRRLGCSSLHNVGFSPLISSMAIGCLGIMDWSQSHVFLMASSSSTFVFRNSKTSIMSQLLR